jgi:ketosteroid isomerase-like protein
VAHDGQCASKELERQDAATAATLNGDPRPYIAAWAVSHDVTVFGAWGRIEKGHERVTETLRWVGSRITGAEAVDVEHTVIACGGDLAYTVGFERSHVSVDSGPLHDMLIRITQIYRRIDGDWKLVHRHADFPSPDQRNTATG